MLNLLSQPWDYLTKLEITKWMPCIIVYDLASSVLLVSPTASGKSLIIYILIRYYCKLLEGTGGCVLLLVPTTSLVEQMFSDFKEYGWNAEYYCHRIYAGKEKESPKYCYISTWQSLYQQPKSYFKRFAVIFGDEIILSRLTHSRRSCIKLQSVSTSMV